MNIEELRVSKNKPADNSTISALNLIDNDSKDIIIDFSDYIAAASSGRPETPNATISTKFNEKINDKNKTLKTSYQTSLNIFNQIFSENQDASSSITSRKEFRANNQSNYDNKIRLLEQQVAEMMKTETKLKGDISRLRIERDSYKSMLKNNNYFNELTHSISNLSNCLLSNRAISDIKFNHQIIMKNLIDDSLSEKVKEVDLKLLEITRMNDRLKEICKEEIRSSKELYSVSLKYSLLCHSLLSIIKDEVRSTSK
jgi:hypothetical protein